MESYPPILRNLSHHHHDGSIQVNPIKDPDPIPTIDLKLLNHEMNDELEDACKNWGLFRLENHGVPMTLLSQLQEEAKKLFSMSFETKQGSCSGTPINYFWGTPALTPSGTALSGGPQNMNWVEGFDVPLGQLSKFQQPQLHAFESFRNLLVEYGNHLARIATTLFEAMVKNLALNLGPSSKSYLSENTGTIRVYRYPNCSNPSVGWGMEMHTDSSVLSILSQDDQVCGLEVLKDDQWLSVKPVFNTLIVNLGDMIQALSNDKYKSAKHRVKMNKDKERTSVCYFVFPDEDIEIQSSNYKPFTYNEFRAQVQQDIKELGYKVGLPRFEHNQDIMN